MAPPFSWSVNHMETVVYIEADADQQLAELGLDATVLIQAVTEGQLAYDTCTENDPRIFPGQLAWARTVRTLREELAPLGWTREEPSNQPLVLNPDGDLAIAVFSGDQATGQLAGNPQPRNPKGAVTLSAVEENERQLSLFQLPAPEPGKDPDRLTWVLLVSRNRDEVRAELSLPGAVGEGGTVLSWAERIILPAIPLDGEPELVRPEEEPPVDVEVVRKSS